MQPWNHICTFTLLDNKAKGQTALGSEVQNSSRSPFCVAHA